MSSLKWVDAFIALGGNEGSVLQHFANTLSVLFRHDGVLIRAISSAYRTQAEVPGGVPPEALADYWNAVVRLDTTLMAQELLFLLHDLERKAGRVRHYLGQSRPLDLDLLIYDQHVSNDPALLLPHPRLASRIFVLRPLAELARELKIPGREQTVADLLACQAQPDRGILEIRGNWVSKNLMDVFYVV